MSQPPQEVGMFDKSWVLSFENVQGRAGESKHDCEETALIQARDYLRQHFEVYEIQGPNGEIVDKAKIENWVKAHPVVC
jgi:hypothetical protein